LLLEIAKKRTFAAMNHRIKIGVIGVGHLGRIHLKLLQQIPLFEVIGFYDPHDANAQLAQTQFQATRYTDLDALMQAVDALDIVCATAAHAQHALQGIAAGKHVFVEKPLAANLPDAEKIVQALAKTKLKGQVGHVERFNPAFKAIQHLHLQPQFIEVHRLALFNPRGADVSVVHDLMIHDLDIIAGLVKSPIKHVAASGVAIVSNTPDIVNARIEFENACVANVTASRLSLKMMRKMRIFQQDAYISVDFLDKKADIARLSDAPPPEPLVGIPLLPNHETELPRYIIVEQPSILENNAIADELTLFAQTILYNQPEVVPLSDGLRAMQLVEAVMNEVNK
jgi:predicted dehydrogenase